jgi:hypothetical protein
MKNLKRIILSVGMTALIGCGGGGGGESGACSALKINGGESCDDAVPTVALVVAQYGNNRTVSCTGTLISETAVLTAAHCFPGAPNAIAIEIPGYRRSASSYFIHPKFRGVEHGFDLAIIKFNEPISVGQTPILVSSGAPNQGDELVTYGYGFDENGNLAPDRVQSGEAPLKASQLTFSADLGGLFYKTISNGSGNICKGDSGGPVLARNQKGEWGIIAVTSFSPELSETVVCVPTQQGSLSVMSPTQNDSAMAFIVTHVPDAALN